MKELRRYEPSTTSMAIGIVGIGYTMFGIFPHELKYGLPCLALFKWSTIFTWKRHNGEIGCLMTIAIGDTCFGVMFLYIFFYLVLQNPEYVPY